MGLESGTYVNDLVTTNPTATDGVTQGDDHLRLIKSTLKTTFPDASRPIRRNKGEVLSADETVVVGDENRFYAVSTASVQVDITLPTLTADDAGWRATFQKTNSGGNNMVISPPSGTINGATELTISKQYTVVHITWDGTAYRAIVLDAIGELTSANVKTLIGYPTITTDNIVPRFNGTTGDMQVSTVVINDDGSIAQTSTGAETIPRGTTAQRPTPAVAMLRENSNLNAVNSIEHYNGSEWRQLSRPLLNLQHRVEANTSGGSYSSASGWATRPLNLEAVDEIGSTLSSNQFTLPAGKYDADIISCHYGVDPAMQTRLWNITDDELVLPGMGTIASTGGEGNTSFQAFLSVRGRFTLDGTKTLAVQNRGSSGSFGDPSNFGIDELYADVRIYRIA